MSAERDVPTSAEIAPMVVYPASSPAGLASVRIRLGGPVERITSHVRLESD